MTEKREEIMTEKIEQIKKINTGIENSGVEDATAAVIESDSGWIKNKRYYYWLSMVIPGVPMLSAYLAGETGNGLYLWGLMIIYYGLFSIIDHMSGLDAANPNDELVAELAKDRYYVYILYGATIMHWLAFIYMAYVVGTNDFSWFSVLGAALSIGLANGLGIVIGHELGHKVNDKMQVFFAKIVLSLSGYGHFFIEHNKGHHKDVATPEDPATSRFGETIYKFVQREVPGAFRRAWELESGRLQRLGKSEWSMSNEIIQPALITITAYTLLIAYLGPIMIPFLIIATLNGWWLLTTANYIEHYGLMRERDANGRYERCQARHSWNSNNKISNLLLLHLQRHSDHHAHPTRPYQSLRDYPEVPSMPSGYPYMMFISMFPSIWFSTMNSMVSDWAEGDMDKVNIDPDVRDEMYKRYHNPKVAKAA